MIQDIINNIKIEELINNNEYKELINNLEEIYDLNSNVSIIQDNFVFPSSILRKDFELFTKSLDNKNTNWDFALVYRNHLLKELNKEMENYNNLFLIHYYVLSIIEKKYRDYKVKIRDEKEKINECLIENKKNIKRIFVLVANPYDYRSYKKNIDIYPSKYIQGLINKIINNSKEEKEELHNYLEITNYPNDSSYKKIVFTINMIMQENSNQKENKTIPELTRYIKKCIEFQKYICKLGGVNKYQEKIKNMINELKILDISSINNIEKINQKLDQCYNVCSHTLIFKDFLYYKYLNTTENLEYEIIIKRYFELLRKKYYIETNNTNNNNSINNQEKYHWIEDYILNDNNSSLKSINYSYNLITKIVFHECDEYMENTKIIMNDDADEILSFYKIEKEEKMPYLVLISLWLFCSYYDNPKFTDDYIKHFNITQSKIEKPITKEAIIDYLNHNEVPINTLEEINKLLIKR